MLARIVRETIVHFPPERQNTKSDGASQQPQPLVGFVGIAAASGRTASV